MVYNYDNWKNHYLASGYPLDKNIEAAYANAQDSEQEVSNAFEVQQNEESKLNTAKLQSMQTDDDAQEVVQQLSDGLSSAQSEFESASDKANTLTSEAAAATSAAAAAAAQASSLAAVAASTPQTIPQETKNEKGEIVVTQVENPAYAAALAAAAAAQAAADAAQAQADQLQSQASEAQAVASEAQSKLDELQSAIQEALSEDGDEQESEQDTEIAQLEENVGQSKQALTDAQENLKQANAELEKAKSELTENKKDDKTNNKGNKTETVIKPDGTVEQKITDNDGNVLYTMNYTNTNGEQVISLEDGLNKYISQISLDSNSNLLSSTIQNLNTNKVINMQKNADGTIATTVDNCDAQIPKMSAADSDEDGKSTETLADTAKTIIDSLKNLSESDMKELAKALDVDVELFNNAAKYFQGSNKDFAEFAQRTCELIEQIGVGVEDGIFYENDLNTVAEKLGVKPEQFVNLVEKTSEFLNDINFDELTKNLDDYIGVYGKTAKISDILKKDIVKEKTGLSEEKLSEISDYIITLLGTDEVNLEDINNFIKDNKGDIIKTTISGLKNLSIALKSPKKSDETKNSDKTDETYDTEEETEESKNASKSAKTDESASSSKESSKNNAADTATQDKTTETDTKDGYDRENANRDAIADHDKLNTTNGIDNENSVKGLQLDLDKYFDEFHNEYDRGQKFNDYVEKVEAEILEDIVEYYKIQKNDDGTYNYDEVKKVYEQIAQSAGIAEKINSTTSEAYVNDVNEYLAMRSWDLTLENDYIDLSNVKYEAPKADSTESDSGANGIDSSNDTVSTDSSQTLQTTQAVVEKLENLNEQDVKDLAAATGLDEKDIQKIADDAKNENYLDLAEDITNAIDKINPENLTEENIDTIANVFGVKKEDISSLLKTSASIIGNIDKENAQKNIDAVIELFGDNDSMSINDFFESSLITEGLESLGINTNDLKTLLVDTLGVKEITKENLEKIKSQISKLDTAKLSSKLNTIAAKIDGSTASGEAGGSDDVQDATEDNAVLKTAETIMKKLESEEGFTEEDISTLRDAGISENDINGMIQNAKEGKRIELANNIINAINNVDPKKIEKVAEVFGVTKEEIGALAKKSAEILGNINQKDFSEKMDAAMQLLEGTMNVEDFINDPLIAKNLEKIGINPKDFETFVSFLGIDKIGDETLEKIKDFVADMDVDALKTKLNQIATAAGVETPDNNDNDTSTDSSQTLQTTQAVVEKLENLNEQDVKDLAAATGLDEKDIQKIADDAKNENYLDLAEDITNAIDKINPENLTEENIDTIANVFGVKKEDISSLLKTSASIIGNIDKENAQKNIDAVIELFGDNDSMSINDFFESSLITEGLESLGINTNDLKTLLVDTLGVKEITKENLEKIKSQISKLDTAKLSSKLNTIAAKIDGSTASSEANGGNQEGANNESNPLESPNLGTNPDEYFRVKSNSDDESKFDFMDKTGLELTDGDAEKLKNGVPGKYILKDDEHEYKVDISSYGDYSVFVDGEYKYYNYHLESNIFQYGSDANPPARIEIVYDDNGNAIRTEEAVYKTGSGNIDYYKIATNEGDSCRCVREKQVDKYYPDVDNYTDYPCKTEEEAMAKTRELKNAKSASGSEDEASDDSEELNTSETHNVTSYDVDGNPDSVYGVVSDGTTYTIAGVKNLILTDKNQADALRNEQIGKYELTDGENTYTVEIAQGSNNNSKYYKVSCKQGDTTIVNAYYGSDTEYDGELCRYTLDANEYTTSWQKVVYNDKGEAQKYIERLNKEYYGDETAIDDKITSRDGLTYKRRIVYDARNQNIDELQYIYYPDAEGYEGYHFKTPEEAEKVTGAINKYNEIKEKYNNGKDLTPSQLASLGLDTIDSMLSGYMNDKTVFDKLLNIELNDDTTISIVDTNTKRSEYYDIIMTIGTENLSQAEINQLNTYKNYLAGISENCQTTAQQLEQICKKLNVNISKIDELNDDDYDTAIEFSIISENINIYRCTEDLYNTSTGKVYSSVSQTTYHGFLGLGGCTVTTTKYNKDGSKISTINSYPIGKEEPDKITTIETDTYGHETKTVKTDENRGIVKFDSTGAPYEFTYNGKTFKIKNMENGLRFVTNEGTIIDTKYEIYKNYEDLIGEKFW